MLLEKMMTYDYDNNRYDRAYKMTSEILELEPENYPLRIRLLQICIKTNRFDQANDIIEQLYAAGDTQIKTQFKSFPDMLAKWKAAGHEPDSCYTTAFTLGCVLADDEPPDSPRAKIQAGPLVATVFQHLIKVDEHVELGMIGSTDLDGAVAEYQKFYNAYEPADARYMQLYRGELQWLLPEEEHLITGDLIREIALTGSVDELRERIRRLRDAGYSQLTIQLVNGHEDALDDWARVIEGV